MWLPIEADRPDLFAVRVCGHSMDGGRAPLRDGDWAVLRLASGAPASTAALTSDNPSGPTFDAGPDTMVIAKLERAISPESLAPPTGTVIADDDLATRFGLHELHPKTGRHAGHLFLFIDTKGVLESPDRLRLTGLPTPWPGETGFALARESNTTWR